MLIRTIRTRAVATICALVGVVGCDTGGTVAPSGPDQAGSLYVVHTRVSSGDQETSYLVTVPSIERDSTFSLRDGIELDSPDVSLVRLDGTPFVYTGSCSEPTITRWKVENDGGLTKGPVLSFAGLGLADACLNTTLGLYAPDKAFHVEFQTGDPLIVVWNPTTMAITGTISLPDVAPIGSLLPVITLYARADRLFAVVFWQESFNQDWTNFGDHVRVITIDPATNQILGSTDEPRCNELESFRPTANGTMYFSPYSGDTPLRSILGAAHGVDSCGLRIVPPGTEFDQGYEVDLSEIVGGRPAGDLVPLDDKTAFVHAWHADLVDAVRPDLSNWQDVVGQNGFLWWKWTVGNPTAELVPNQLPGNYTVLTTVDGRTFENHWSNDFSSTTLQELDPAGAIRPALSGQGQIFEVVRVR